MLVLIELYEVRMDTHIHILVGSYNTDGVHTVRLRHWQRWYLQERRMEAVMVSHWHLHRRSSSSVFCHHLRIAEEGVAVHLYNGDHIFDRLLPVCFRARRCKCRSSLAGVTVELRSIRTEVWPVTHQTVWTFRTRTCDLVTGAKLRTTNLWIWTLVSFLNTSVFFATLESSDQATEACDQWKKFSQTEVCDLWPSELNVILQYYDLDIYTYSWLKLFYLRSNVSDLNLLFYFIFWIITAFLFAETIRPCSRVLPTSAECQDSYSSYKLLAAVTPI